MQPTHRRRPVTAPTQHSPTAALVTANDQLTNPLNLTTTVPPKLPPIPIILSHSPSRAHLFNYLLSATDSISLSHLILLLDLLAIIRGHASQTNWLFDEPESPTPTATPTKPIRPGTSDGLSTSRLRQHTRSHLFRHAKPAPSQPTPTSSWLHHLQELYNPPQSDVIHGWFIPIPLPPRSPTFISLSQQLSTNNSNNLNHQALDSLKQVGQLACEELAQFQSVRDWWSQNCAQLWPICSRLQKSQCFNDLLSLWPSLHFPTPSLSQLYKISSNLSKSRTRLRLTASPSEHVNHSFHSRATLRALFEIYLGQPSSADLKSIEQFVINSRSVTPSPNPLQHSSNTPSQQSPLSQAHVSPTHCLPESDPLRHFTPRQSKSLDLRSQKLRRFFGHEVDSILPPHQEQPVLGSDHSTAPYLSTYSISNVSVSLGTTPIRRKSTTSPVDMDRPRKRSSIATIDISLATLTASSHTEVEQPSTPPPLSPQPFGRKSLSTPYPRFTVVGTSPSNTPPFSGPNRTLSLRGPRLQSAYPDDLITEIIDPKFTNDSINEEPDGRSSWEKPAPEDADAIINLKRLTKLEKILGHPFASTSHLPYSGLGVQVVQEIVQNVEIDEMSLKDDRHNRDEVPPSSTSPHEGNDNFNPKVHSRASSSSQTSFDISRERFASPTSSCQFPCTTRSSFELNYRSLSRPNTAQSESNYTLNSPSLATAKNSGKRRLGKLQKFLGDVTLHHQKLNPPINLSTKASNRVKHDQIDSNRNQAKSKFDNHSQQLEQAFNNINSTNTYRKNNHLIRKQTSSFFKFTSSCSSSSQITSSSSLTAYGNNDCNNLEWNSFLKHQHQEQHDNPTSDHHDHYLLATSTTHSFLNSNSNHLTRNDAGDLAPASTTHSNSSFPTTSASHFDGHLDNHHQFIYCSHRNTRKLEKLLGEQIPRNVDHSYFLNSNHKHQNPQQETNSHWKNEVNNGLEHH